MSKDCAGRLFRTSMKDVFAADSVAYQPTFATFAIPDISACELVANSRQPMVFSMKCGQN